VNTLRNRRGFTLIELMIVIGIIAVLVAVLALAVLPWLGKSSENNTRTILNSVGSLLAGDAERSVPSLDRFRKDVGQNLTGQVSSDPKRASAQLMMFYYAPTKEAWEKSTYYKGKQYDPKVDPKSWAEFTLVDGSAPDLPMLTDGWNQPLYYYYDKAEKIVIVRSFGKNGKEDAEDDLAFDGGSGQVKFWSEMVKAK